MRVWDCDPGFLADKHLRAQHAEIHFAIRVIENNWRTRWKDVERFRSHPDGLKWLGFIHDVTIYELQKRGKFINHKTPVHHNMEFINQFYLWDSANLRPNWLGFLIKNGYPLTKLNQGTPWERDKVSFAWYRSHEKDWTKALAKEEAKRTRIRS